MVRKFRLLWFQNQNGITENPSGHKMAPFISELKTVKKNKYSQIKLDASVQQRIHAIYESFALKYYDL